MSKASLRCRVSDNISIAIAFVAHADIPERRSSFGCPKRGSREHDQEHSRSHWRGPRHFSDLGALVLLSSAGAPAVPGSTSETRGEQPPTSDASLPLAAVRDHASPLVLCADGSGPRLSHPASSGTGKIAPLRSSKSGRNTKRSWLSPRITLWPHMSSRSHECWLKQTPSRTHGGGDVRVGQHGFAGRGAPSTAQCPGAPRADR
jgi:hypothetical protein